METLTGAEWGARIRAAASLRGKTPAQFLEVISAQPAKWLWQLEQAERPKPGTIDRITALIDGRDIPPTKPSNTTISERKARNAPLFPRELVSNPARATAPRDPCARCGVRADRHAAGGCKRYVAP